MSTATDHPRLAWEDLSPRIKGRTGATADAADSFSDAVLYLLDALYDGQTTKAAADVAETIDQALAVLHTIRDEALQENRRRTDAVMERTAYLEGDAR